MTRINVIPVEELTDQHMMAEYRELPMIHGSLKRTLASKTQSGLQTIPEQYTLNAGHVKFFYNKKSFLLERYNNLVDCLLKRGYNIVPSERSVDWSVFDSVKEVSWEPCFADQQLNVERIIIRLEDKINWYRYCGKIIDCSFVMKMKEKYIELL